MPAAKNPGLVLRRLADKSGEERVVRYDSVTGESMLLDPKTCNVDDPSTWEHTPWPEAGIAFEGDPPKRARVPTSTVSRGLAEGWIEIKGLRPVHRPGGPPADPWKVTHTFSHYDTITFHTVDGDVTYKVVRQPDKYVANKPDSAKVTDAIYAAGDTAVDWFYDLELED